MDEPGYNSLLFSSSPTLTNLIASDFVASASTSSSSQAQEGEVEQQQQQHQHQQRTTVSYRLNITISDLPSSYIRNDAWSCFFVLIGFWFFVSTTLILGFYGSVNLQLGPNCSRLLQVNSFFVNKIKAQEVDKLHQSPMLYGFHTPPPLDVEITWSETHNTSIPANSHKKWIYFLNEGSELVIQYSMRSQSSYPLSLVIAEGKESLHQWVEDPSYPNITLSWNIIHGSGTVQQKIFKSSDYYVAVGNLNPEEVEVNLNFRIQAFLYNTTKAYYKCSLTNGICGLKLFLLRTSAAVLTSPGPIQGTPTDDLFVKLSYGPRWISYLLSSGTMTVFILLALKMCTKFQSSIGDGTERVGSGRTPLLAHKDDDLSSWGSSYDSVSQDEDDLEDLLALGSLNGKPLKDGENNNPRLLCTICFDASRDSFFLPCGHCATCFTCGTRIMEEAVTCPICHRKMKKVRKIFTV